MRWRSSRIGRPRQAARLPVLAIAALLAACAARHPTLQPSPASAHLRTLHTDLDRIFDAPDFAGGFWGVAVEDADTGQPVYLRNADKLLLPASNMKILTLAAAVQRLTWNFRYDTKLLAAGPIENGTLHGDLVAIGSGDPTVDDFRRADARSELAAWADELWARGLRTIDGRVIGDGRAFRGRPFGAGWAWDDLAYGFAAPVSALQYHDNLVVLTVTPGAAPGQPATIASDPGETGLTIVNDVTTTAAATPAMVLLQRNPGAAVLTLKGTIAAGSAPVYRTAAVLDPMDFFARNLRAALIARGIGVTGAAMDMLAATPPPAEEGAQLLLSAPSPPLSDMATVLMKDSENLYAETLLRTMAIVAPPADGSGVAGIAHELLTSLGLPPASAVVADGSGLSRYNLLTPRTLAEVLRRFRADPTFVAALPIAGDDGTLAHRFEGTAAAGQVHAKTGTMSHVHALSGYLTTRDGRPLVFSILANNFDVPPQTVTAAIDAAVVRLIGLER